MVNDLIHGVLRFDNKLFDDFVIRKSDGMATYNFAVVIDDATMKITHVIRRRRSHFQYTAPSPGL